jgi:exodeoxyribonuclease VII large subunit
LRRVLAGIRGELEAGTAALASAMRHQLLLNRVRLERMSRALDTLSPLAILNRGYALVFDSAGQLVKDASLLQPGSEITARLARGQIDATVKRISTESDSTKSTKEER